MSVTAAVLLFVWSASLSEGSALPPRCSDVLSPPSSRALTPPPLHGTWTSTSCETRSGPLYVLRSYTFIGGLAPSSGSERGQFVLRLHQYSDEGCTAPWATHTARGEWEAMRHSWTLPGATEMDYSLHRVTAVPHTAAAAATLSTRVGRACPYHSTKSWKVGRSYKVLWFPLEDDPHYTPRGRKGSHLPPTTQHSVVYFHDEATNTTRTVPLETHHPTEAAGRAEVPSYIEQGLGYRGFPAVEKGGYHAGEGADSRGPARVRARGGVKESAEPRNVAAEQHGRKAPTSGPPYNRLQATQSPSKRLSTNEILFNPPHSSLTPIFSNNDSMPLTLSVFNSNPEQMRQWTTHLSTDKSILDTTFPATVLREDSKPLAVEAPSPRVLSDWSKDDLQFDCTAYLGVSWHELQLVRITESQASPSSAEDDLLMESNLPGSGVKRELFLGEVTSQEGREDRPAAYQTPLLHAYDGVASCGTCRLVLRGNEARPPRLLPAIPLTPVPRLEGEWASPACEAVRQGLFRTRQMRFGPGDSWSIEQLHYSDPLCLGETFSLVAGGSYRAVTPRGEHLKRSAGHAKEHDLFSGAKEQSDGAASWEPRLNPAFSPPRSHYPSLPVVLLLMQRLLITPLDAATARQLNYTTGGCGRPGSWKKGVGKDTLSGCDALGISVPALYRQAVKFEQREGSLFLLVGEAAAASEEMLRDIRFSSTGSVPATPLQEGNNNTHPRVEGVNRPYHSHHIHQLDLSSLVLPPGVLSPSPLSGAPWAAPLQRCSSKLGSARQPIMARQASTAPAPPHLHPMGALLLLVLKRLH